MVADCGPHPTRDEARRFISLCQPQAWKCLRQYDSEFLRVFDRLHRSLVCQLGLAALFVFGQARMRDMSLEYWGFRWRETVTKLGQLASEFRFGPPVYFARMILKA